MWRKSMKNHKINYKKYIVLAAVLALGVPTIHSTYQVYSEVKYEESSQQVDEGMDKDYIFEVNGVKIVELPDEALSRAIDSHTTAQRVRDNRIANSDNPYRFFLDENISRVGNYYVSMLGYANGRSLKYAQASGGSGNQPFNPTSDFTLYTNSVVDFEGIQFLEHVEKLQINIGRNVQNFAPVLEMRNLKEISLIFDGASDEAILNILSQLSTSDLESINILMAGSHSVELSDFKILENNSDLKHLGISVVGGHIGIPLINHDENSEVTDLELFDNFESLEHLTINGYIVQDYGTKNFTTRVYNNERYVPSISVADYMDENGKVVIPLTALIPDIEDIDLEILNDYILSAPVRDIPRLSFDYEETFTDTSFGSTVEVVDGNIVFNANERLNNTLLQARYRLYSNNNNKLTENLDRFGYAVRGSKDRLNLNSLYERQPNREGFLESGMVFIGILPEEESGVAESAPELEAEPLVIEQAERDFQPLEELIYNALDDIDGELTDKVEVVENTVNPLIPGIYDVKLAVTNSFGKTVERVVQVQVLAPELEEPEPEDEEPVEDEEDSSELEKEPELEDEEVVEEVEGNEEEPDVEVEELDEDEELEEENEEDEDLEAAEEDKVEPEPEVENEEREELEEEIVVELEDDRVLEVIEKVTSEEKTEVLRAETEEKELLQTGINASYLQPLGAVLTGLSGFALFKFKKK